MCLVYVRVYELQVHPMNYPVFQVIRSKQVRWLAGRMGICLTYCPAIHEGYVYRDSLYTK